MCLLKWEMCELPQLKEKRSKYGASLSFHADTVFYSFLFTISSQSFRDWQTHIHSLTSHNSKSPNINWCPCFPRISYRSSQPTGVKFTGMGPLLGSNSGRDVIILGLVLKQERAQNSNAAFSTLVPVLSCNVEAWGVKSALFPLCTAPAECFVPSIILPWQFKSMTSKHFKMLYGLHFIRLVTLPPGILKGATLGNFSHISRFKMKSESYKLTEPPRRQAAA